MNEKPVMTRAHDDLLEIVLNHAARRNALSMSVITELRSAVEAAGRSDARAVILSAAGPVFCAGHDFEDMAGRNLLQMKELLQECRLLMESIQKIPQPVVASVQGLATGAGCQLALTCDLVVASEEASFATPGGKGGWFCTTPMVAVTRAIGSKRALEMLFTGDPVPAATALQWGMVNRVVAVELLEQETLAFARRVSRGSPTAKGIGKQAFYTQIGQTQYAAYDYATEVMAASSMLDDAQQGMKAFLERRSRRPNSA